MEQTIENIQQAIQEFKLQIEETLKFHESNEQNEHESE